MLDCRNDAHGKWSPSAAARRPAGAVRLDGDKSVFYVEEAIQVASGDRQRRRISAPSRCRSLPGGGGVRR